MGFIL